MANSNLSNALFKTLSGDKWDRIGTGKKAGVLLPLSSVYSKKSLGIGDFRDLKLVVDWCNKTENSVLQLLPMNEVGYTFCPYDALSSFALEPVYVSFQMMPLAKNKAIREKIKNIAGVFPSGKMHLDYRIKKEKVALLKEIFLMDKASEKGLEEFRLDNSYWIDDFALFKVLKEHHGGMPWYEWEDCYKNRSGADLEAFQKQNKQEIDFEIWMQWQLYTQFAGVKDYAESKNILIKGDLPILVSRDSADVWAHREFFNLEFVAGAPPDMYCSKGQRWGTPTYNWERIASDGYNYLINKLHYAQNFYDILRVDHVVGLFRIWSIAYNDPVENKGLNGSFDPPEESKWKAHGETILSVMLKNTNMLLCAEDLGVIPDACPQILKQLGIPGNDVGRWVKDWKVRHDFLPPSEYRELAVAMLSTHDTTNWASWWEDEAGTVDEALFVRKCKERGIDFNLVKDKLFDPHLSRHGRLRWLKAVCSPEILIDYLGRRKEEVADFAELYENSYCEKEKFWKMCNMKGQMREKANRELIAAALKITLESRAIMCIQLLTDWLYLTDIFSEDAYLYRINTPGTTSDQNWSLTYPISLEKLLANKVNSKIKKMVIDSKRGR